MNGIAAVGTAVELNLGYTQNGSEATALAVELAFLLKDRSYNSASTMKMAGLPKEVTLGDILATHSRKGLRIDGTEGWTYEAFCLMSRRDGENLKAYLLAKPERTDDKAVKARAARAKAQSQPRRSQSGGSVIADLLRQQQQQMIPAQPVQQIIQAEPAPAPAEGYTIGSADETPAPAMPEMVELEDGTFVPVIEEGGYFAALREDGSLTVYTVKAKTVAKA